MKVSDLARPPIQPHEIQGAQDSLCRNHKGTIANEREGSVWYCPVGRQYWRYSTQRSDFNRPLPYKRSGVL